MLAEGEKRLLHIWNGYGFHAKVYEEADLSYSITITQDFPTPADAIGFVNSFSLFAKDFTTWRIADTHDGF